MELKIPIEVGFDDLESLLDDLKKLQTYKCFEGAEEVLVDIEDVAKVLMDHVKVKKSVKTDDMISRQDVIEYLVDNVSWFDEDGCEPDEDEKRYIIERLINGMSSSQPERKKGKWIDAYPDIEPNPMFMYGICSVCGCEQAISNKLNFCPDCGADMRGEQDE